MTTRGSVQTLTATFYEAAGEGVVDPTDVSLSVLFGGAVVHGPVAPPAVVRDGVGLYRYEWTIPLTSEPGTYTAQWTALLPGQTDADVGYESFEVTAHDVTSDADLVVTPEELAVAAELGELTAAQRTAIREAILDAQADVVSYLGRVIIPATRTEAGLYPWPEGWEFRELGDEPLIEVNTVTAETDPYGQPTGYFTVTYTYGIDARTDEALRPIRRYVKVHAMNSPEFTRLWKVDTSARGEVRSLSAEGQSVSFAAPTLAGVATTGTKPGDLTPGSLPTLASLDYWRLAGRRVYQSATRVSDWPFSGRRW